MEAFETQRPPEQQFQVVWDVDEMLEYLRSLGENKDLSFKTLTRKTVMLVALIAFSRQSEISYLNISRSSETNLSLVIFFEPVKKLKEITKTIGIP